MLREVARVHFEVGLSQQKSIFCTSLQLLSILSGTLMSRLEDKTIEDIAEWLEQQGFNESVIESFRRKCYASRLVCTLSYCLIRVS